MDMPGDGVIIAMVCVPQLGGDEDFVPGNAAFTDSDANAFFVAVSLGCVAVAIACFQGCLNGGNSYISVRGLPGTEDDAGDLHTIEQLITISCLVHHLKSSFAIDNSSISMYHYKRKS